MNKVLNWIFGTCFRTLGRLLAIFLVGLLLIFIGSKLGLKIPDFLMPLKISASEQPIPYDSDSYFRINTCDARDTGTCSWVSGQTLLGSTKNLQSGHTLNAFLVRFKGSFSANTQYKFVIKFTSTPGIRTIHSESSLIKSSACYGSKNGESSQEVINGCRLNDVIFEDNSNVIQFIMYATPKTNQEYIQFNYYFNLPLTMILESFRVGTTSKIYIETSVVDAITDSTNQIIDSQDKTNEKLDNIEDTLTDTSSPDISGMTNLAGYLPPGPLDSVLNLPLSILNSINTKLTSSCTPLTLTLPFVNLPLTIPCLSTIFNQINGLSTLFEFIGVICGALIMYSYLTYLYNWVDDVTSLKHNKARLFGAKSDVDNWGGVE